MIRHHPEPRAQIPVSPKVHFQLLAAVFNSDYKKECWEITEEAIDEWVRRHNPDAIPLPATKGYQWKSLFLPDGTLLRTVFGAKNHHCLVENDSILYNGKAVSPSGFVDAVGGIRRNAWRCIWVLLPENKEWKLADALRSRERPRRERKPARVAPQASAGHASATGAPANVPTAAEPISAHAEPIMSSAAEEQRAPPSGLHHESRGGRRRSGTAHFSQRCSCGAERRSSADGAMSPSLREELRQLLYRLDQYEWQLSAAGQNSSHGNWIAPQSSPRPRMSEAPP